MIFLIIFTTYYLLHDTIVYASEVSLGLYPPIVQIDANPPAQIKTPLNIQNNATDPVVLEISFQPFTAADSKNGTIQFLSSQAVKQTADPNIFQKIQLLENGKNTDQIELGPQEQKQLTLAIDLPKQEPPSDYYFSIIFTSKGQVIDQKTASAINGGIATNVLLSIGPKDKASGSLAEFSTPFFYDHGPVPFTVGIENTSKHFIVPQGIIVIKNIFGQIVGKVDLLPVNILSQTTRFIPDKDFSSQNRAVWKESFLLGSYSAEITTALSPDGPLYKKTIYFFALPFQFIVGLIIGCILTAITIVRVRKKLKNR